MMAVAAPASGELPDVLAVDLRVIFVGTAAGRRSAAAGAYYAHPGNRFWRTLHEVGMMPCKLDPAEFRKLLADGIGFTDIAKNAAGMDHEIAPEHYDLAGFAAKLDAFKPRVVAFTSKKAASIWFGVPTGRLKLGLQPKAVTGAPEIFVLTSPSGAASRYWSIEPWCALARVHQLSR